MLFAFANLNAQKGIQLEHRHLAETTYLTSMKMDVEMSMLVPELPDVKDIPDEMGDTMVMTMLMDMDIRNAFGSENENGRMEFLMEYDSMNTTMYMNGEEQKFPNATNDQLRDMKIQGSVVGSEMYIDSVSGVAIDSATAAALKGNLQGMQVLIKFPDHPLKVGDTFEQTNEIVTNAGAAGQVTALVHQTYRLERYDDEFAYLSMQEVYEFLKSTNDMATVKGNGTGQGEVKFSRADKTVVEYDNTSMMELEMEVMGTAMLMTSKNKVTIENRIEN